MRAAISSRILAALLTLTTTTAFAVSSDIVISEFRTRGPSGGNDEFVELFNLSSAPVNIGGWKINGSNNAGTTSTRLTINANTILNPGCRFLATNSAAAGYSGVTPGNQTYATGFADDGGVAVLTAANAVIDAVGMSAGSAYKEGTTLAPTTTNAERSQERKPAGQNSQDTDSNTNDFTLNAGSSNPQNLSSACTPVGSGGNAVNLSVSSNAASESAPAAITVTATAGSAVSGNQTVSLTVTGTGITAGDYTLSSATLTIPDGATSGSATFTVVDDTLAEGTETAVLSIGSPSAGIVLGATISQNIVIADNDTAVTKISAIQGSGSASPLVGQSVTIEGIVVGDYQGASGQSLQGFFVQEEDADSDGDPATSEGILVFDGVGAVPVSVGDKVRVSGTVAEFFGMTEISPVASVTVVASNEAAPASATVALPVPIAPTENLTTDTAAINAYYERFEGMTVNVPATLSLSEYFELERFGQVVLSQGGRIPTFTAATAPGVAAYIGHQVDVARRQIILDDLNNAQNSALTNGTPLFHPQPGLSITNRFRGGDTISNLSGVLHWSFAGFSGTDAWRIRPVTQRFSYAFASLNPRPSAPPSVGGSLKVASFNLLNYFTTIDTTASGTTGPCGPNGLQDCRGADSTDELNRQTAKAIAALCGANADVYGLVELENNATASLSSLVTAANAVSGCGPYAFVNTGTIGGDAIKVGLIYKTSSVATVGSHAILSSAFNADFIDTKNRPSLAQTFRQLAGNAKFTVAVNHFKSKGSACDDVADPDAGDGQGNCNLTRKKAAQVLVDWLATDPTASSDPDVLILGDLNSYAKEDPIAAVIQGSDDLLGTGDDYTDLSAALGGAAAYSYVFDGQTGYLDYALASSKLRPQVTGTRDWHINADEPPSFDYNDTVATTGEQSFEAKPSALPLYEPNAFRTSDHDIVLVGLALDTDGDGLPDALEAILGTNPLDLDSDDDGIADGTEDTNRNGLVDSGETNPTLADTDGDGIQDGTETGVTAGVADPDGTGPLLGTNGSIFVPDADPTTTTSALSIDSDGDGIADGIEDGNRNGRVDAGESNPNLSDTSEANVPVLGFWPAMLLASLLAGIGVRQRNSQKD